MKPINVKASKYIDFDVKNNDKDCKFKVGDQASMLKYKNIFAKVYTQNCSEEDFVYREYMLFVMLTVKKLLERLTKKNCKRKIKQSLELKR